MLDLFMNAISEPSGDQAGNSPAQLMDWRPDPSALITQNPTWALR